MNETPIAQKGTLTTMIDVIASPAEAFRRLKEKPKFLWVLLLLMLSVSAVQFIYMTGVDIEWFYGEQLANQGNMTEAQVEQAVRFMTSFPQPALAALAALTGPLFIGLLFLVQALYLKIITAITKDGLTYKQLVALICWSSFPTIFSNLAQIANLLASDVSLMPSTALNPLAIWPALGLEPIGTGTLDLIVMQMDPTTIWNLVLLTIGYRIFSDKGLATSAIIAFIPTVLIVGLAFAY